MKVRELIELLKNVEQEAEINVFESLPNRPMGGNLKPVHDVTLYFDQDTNRPKYVIEPLIEWKSWDEVNQQVPDDEPLSDEELSQLNNNDGYVDYKRNSED